MWTKCSSALVVVALLVPTVRAQVGGAAPGAGGVAGAPGAGGPAAAAGQTGMLANLGAMCASCKEAFCASTFGQFINNSMAPVRMFSGGLVPPCCPLTPSAAQLAAPADSPEGAAARIKADEAAAKERRANVRYLGTVDCRYWPEAQEALISALRADRNECVRLEAALALARGCCCNNSTIVALTLTVTGSEEDGKPAEASDRVREVALMALNSCLARVSAEPEAIVTPEKGPDPKDGERNNKDTSKPSSSPAAPLLPPLAAKAPVIPPTYYQRIARLPRAQVVAYARRAVDKLAASGSATGQARSGPSSVFDIVHGAIASPAVEQRVVNPPSIEGNVNPALHQQPAGTGMWTEPVPVIQSSLSPPYHLQPAGPPPHAVIGVIWRDN
jgi:hypothetical protein